MVVASLLFAIMNVIVKYLDHVPVAQIVFMRSSVMMVMVASLLIKKRIKPLGTKRRLLVLRGLFGTVGIAFFFYTLHHMPLASAVVVHYLTPIFTALLAFLLVKERLKPIQLVFFALCFAGILVIKGFDARVDGLVLSIGVLGTIGAASAYNIISMLKDSEHHLVIMFYFPLVTIPLVLIYIAITGDWSWVGYKDWLLLITIGVLTYAAQYFLTRSYQDGQVNKVSIVSYLGIVYAIVFGYFIFNESYNWQASLGVAMVVSGVMLNVWFKRK
ncbi:MAG: DMT family transporter [Bacteroidia bacterium]